MRPAPLGPSAGSRRVICSRNGGVTARVTSSTGMVQPGLQSSHVPPAQQQFAHPILRCSSHLPVPVLFCSDELKSCGQ